MHIKAAACRSGTGTTTCSLACIADHKVHSRKCHIQLPCKVGLEGKPGSEEATVRLIVVTEGDRRMINKVIHSSRMKPVELCKTLHTEKILEGMKRDRTNSQAGWKESIKRVFQLHNQLTCTRFTEIGGRAAPERRITVLLFKEGEMSSLREIAC